MQFVGNRIVNPPEAASRTGRRNGAPLSPEQQSSLDRGGAIYTELCFSCHGENGRGTPTPGAAAGSTLAPSLAGSPRVNGHRDYAIKVLLHGLSGPIDGRRYPQVMVAMGGQQGSVDSGRCLLRAQQLRQCREPGDRQTTWRGSAAMGERKAPWTVEELDASLPRVLTPDGTWKMTASHEGQPVPHPNAAGGYNYRSGAAGAVGFLGWTTGVPQQAGMWFQVELPAPVMLTEVQFTASMVGGGDNSPGVSTFPRGYEVRVSSDGNVWSAPVAPGRALPERPSRPLHRSRRNSFASSQTETVTNAPPWSMRLLRLYQAPS